MSMPNKIPEQVKQVLRTLNNNGYEGYIVGGAVRDYVMGAEPHDWDITTDATPEQVKNCFKKTIDTGIKHGTVTAMLDGEGYEITTYRTDGKYSDGRHPDEVKFVKSLKEDLARRDFTINAMAMDADGNIVDPFGGLEDLKSGTIRCVGNPDDRFSEDALRLLRAVRFESKFDFKLDLALKESIPRHTENLKNISAERIRDELTKMLLSKNPTKGFEDAYETGITKVVLPEFDTMMECSQNTPYHYTDVGHHSLDVVKGVSPTFTLRWAALLHDVGKPETKTYDPEKGRERFLGHPEVSARIAGDITKRLRFSNADSDKIIKMITYHDYVTKTPSKIRRFAAEMGKDFFPEFEELRYADAYAHTAKYAPEIQAGHDHMKEKMEKYFADGSVITIQGLKIDGNELQELGIKGKKIGEFLQAAHRDCLGQPSHNTNEFLRQQAEKFRASEERKAQSRLNSLPRVERQADGLTNQSQFDE